MAVGFISGHLPGDEEKGRLGLVGSLEFSCYTESGKIHPVAYCSNIPLEDRKSATVCGNCGSKLYVKDDNVDGKRRVTLVRCEKCNQDYPPPALPL